MNTVMTGSENLVLRIVGNTNENALVPIKSDTCMLAETSADQSTRFECSIKRDESGAYIRSFQGDVKVNHLPPEVNQRLASGDQIDIGQNVYEIHQVGRWLPNQPAEPRPTAPDARLASVNSRIDKLESELSRQSESFEAIHQKFESLGHQMDMLLVSLNGSDQANSATCDTTANDDPQPCESSVDQSAPENEEVSLMQDQLDSTFDQLQQLTESVATQDSADVLQNEVAELTIDAAEASLQDDDDQTFESNDESAPNELAVQWPVQSTEQIEEKIRNEECGQAELTTDEEEQEDDPNILKRLRALTGTESVFDKENEDFEESGAEISAEFDSQPFTDPANDSFETTAESESDQQSTLEGLLSSLRDSANGDETETSESVQSELVESEQETTDPQPSTDSSDLESLFASLRENDQRTIEDVQDESGVLPEPEEDSDHLSELERRLDKWCENGESSSPSSGVSAVDSVSELLDAESTAGFESSVSFKSGEEQSHGESSTERLQNLALELSNQDADSDAESEYIPDSEIELSEPETPVQESVSDVLQRMQALPAFDDEPLGDSQDHAQLQQPVNEAEVIEPVQPTVEPIAEESTPESGTDVQDYMNSLLQRLNNGAENAAVEPVSSVASPAIEPKVTATLVEPVEDDTQNEPPLNAAEFKPKRVAPETNSNLAAMRELANASSRNAVERSNAKKKKQAANTLLLAAGGSIAGALICTFLSKQTGDIFYILSILMYLASFVCSGWYAKNSLFGQSEDNADPADTAN